MADSEPYPIYCYQKDNFYKITVSFFLKFCIDMNLLSYWGQSGHNKHCAVVHIISLKRVKVMAENMTYSTLSDNLNRELPCNVL